jgi:hypothetical protein
MIQDVVREARCVWRRGFQRQALVAAAQFVCARHRVLTLRKQNSAE